MLSRKIIHSILLILSIVHFTSCSLNVPPPDLYSDPDAITNGKAARSLLASCYLLYPHVEYELSTLGNDFCLTNYSGKDVSQQNLYLWQDNSISSFSSETWASYYNCIANCDVLLDRISKAKSASPADSVSLQQTEAEAKTLKAMAYFDLLRLFSSPYDTQDDNLGIVIKSRTGVETVARSSKTACVEYIGNLLKDAMSVKNNPTANGWLSTRAATYLMAELSLYSGNNKDAARYAQMLIDECKPEYISKQNYGRIWGTTSYEGRIFALNINTSFYSGIQYSTDGDYFALNPELQFDKADARKVWTVYNKNILGTERELMGKYNKLNKENANINYVNRMRWAGAYFIAAEAYARMQQDDVAIATINVYLLAIGAQLLDNSLRGDALVKAILHEKYKEFVGEGQNYFDLKRVHTDKLNRLGVWGTSNRSYINKNDYRWTFPIPASEYRYNEAVEQNEGWPINRN